MLISLITSLSLSSPPPNAILICLCSGIFGGFADRLGRINFGNNQGRPGACRRCAGNQISMQLMCEAIEFAENTFIAAVQCVVTEHGGNGYRQAEGGHDQCLTDRPRNFVDTGGAGYADADQCVI